MAGVTYRCAPWATLRIVPLDGLTLIYHRASGVTHVLAPPAPEILAALARGPCAIEALMTRLAADYNLVEADAQGLEARLAELVDAGLVATA